MRLVSEGEFAARVKGIFSNYLDAATANRQPFTERIKSRMVISYIHYAIDEALPISALIAAASLVGDRGCYISSMWEYVPGKPRHCYVPLSEMQEGYAGEPGSDTLIGVKLGLNPYSSGTAIFSPSGLWAIANPPGFSFGVLGGSTEFTDRLIELVPGLENQVIDFIEEDYKLNNWVEWAAKTDPWLAELLIHLYGSTKAKQILEQTQLLHLYPRFFD